MTPPEGSLECWAPEISDAATLARVVDLAFDYRGDVTVVLSGGESVIGYLFNRSREGAAPFVQVFPADGGPSRTLAYASIRRIVFTGRDTAAGNSYAAWLRHRQTERQEAGRA